MRPAVDIQRLRLALASMELWLLELLAWLVDALEGMPLGRKLCPMVRAHVRADLARAEDGVRAVVALLALRLAGGLPPEPPRRALHPSRAPRGVRIGCAGGNPLRHLTRPLKLGGRDLAARIARLRAVIADLDAWAERLRPRLLRAPRWAFRLVQAFADAVPACAPVEPAEADTS